MLNLVVCHISDGREFYIEDGENESWDEFVEDNDGDVAWAEKSLEDGLKECDEYFGIGIEDRTNEEIEEYAKLKEEYIEKIGNRKGKFYIWGIEYDCDLMFIED